MDVHKGLDNSTWDLDGIFKDYYPNLHRKSALIVIYSFFEHELNKLCDLYTQMEDLKVSFRDIKGKGIVRDFMFLEKIIGLQIDRSTALWQEITNIGKTRNLIVHSNSELPIQEKEKQKDAMVIYVEKSPHLSNHNNEISIGENYLPFVLETFKNNLKNSTI